MFKMILQDGTRSDNPFTDGYGRVMQKRYHYFLPQNKRITAVTINYHGCINGFTFHLSDGSNWDIGWIGWGGNETVTIDIAENEVIVGFKSKSHSDCPAIYTEIQFLTMRRPN